jgi:quercetin dioxygenase-like cupin family protein
MALPDRSIDDPLTGQHLTFSDPADHARGSSLRAVVRLEPAGFVPRHLHLRQDEHLEVLAGSIRLRAGGAVRVLGPGDTVTIPRRQLHGIANSGTSEASFVLEVHPARRIERTIRFTFAVGRALYPLARGARLRRLPPDDSTPFLGEDGVMGRPSERPEEFRGGTA